MHVVKINREASYMRLGTRKIVICMLKLFVIDKLLTLVKRLLYFRTLEPLGALNLSRNFKSTNPLHENLKKNTT